MSTSGPCPICGAFLMNTNAICPTCEAECEPEEKSLDDLLAEYCDQESMHNFEMEQGVQNLARIARALGYKDEMYWGQFRDGCYGDLLDFLRDNPGAIQAVLEWIGEQNSPEWKGELESRLEPEEDDHGDGLPEGDIDHDAEDRRAHNEERNERPGF